MTWGDSLAIAIINFVLAVPVGLFWYFGHPAMALIFGFAVVLARLDRILDEVQK